MPANSYWTQTPPTEAWSCLTTGRWCSWLRGSVIKITRTSLRNGLSSENALTDIATGKWNGGEMLISQGVTEESAERGTRLIVCLEWKIIHGVYSALRAKVSLCVTAHAEQPPRTHLLPPTGTTTHLHTFNATLRYWSLLCQVRAVVQQAWFLSVSEFYEGGRTWWQQQWPTQRQRCPTAKNILRRVNYGNTSWTIVFCKSTWTLHVRKGTFLSLSSCTNWQWRQETRTRSNYTMWSYMTNAECIYVFIFK